MNILVVYAGKNKQGLPVRGHESRAKSLHAEFIKAGHSSHLVKDSHLPLRIDLRMRYYDLIAADGHIESATQFILSEQRGKRFTVSICDEEPGLDFFDVHIHPAPVNVATSYAPDEYQFFGGIRWTIVNGNVWDKFNSDIRDEQTGIAKIFAGSSLSQRNKYFYQSAIRGIKIEQALSWDDIVEESYLCDLAIVPASTTMWELVVCECPILVEKTANDQKSNYRFAERNGLTLPDYTLTMNIDQYIEGSCNAVNAIKTQMRHPKQIAKDITEMVS